METHKNIEVTAVRSLTYALNYYDKNPRADSEEIIKNLSKELGFINADGDLKIIGIAAANEGLKLKMKNKKINNKQIIQKIVNKLPEFLETANLNQN